MTRRRDLIGVALASLLGDAALAAEGQPAAVEGCVFCRLVAGLEPLVEVYRDSRVVAFGALHPRQPGHVLLAPLAHVENIYELPEALARHLFAAAVRIARTMKRVLKTDGLTMLQNNEAAGDQTVFHLHVHLIPRYAGHPIWRPATAPLEASIAERERVLAPVRAALR